MNSLPSSAIHLSASILRVTRQRILLDLALSLFRTKPLAMTADPTFLSGDIWGSLDLPGRGHGSIFQTPAARIELAAPSRTSLSLRSVGVTTVFLAEDSPEFARGGSPGWAARGKTRLTASRVGQRNASRVCSESWPNDVRGMVRVSFLFTGRVRRRGRIYVRTCGEA